MTHRCCQFGPIRFDQPRVRRESFEQSWSLRIDY
jgi:hypothetical protein